MKEEIVLPAWQIASENSEIKVFNFFPSLLSTLYLACILLYQVAWSYIYVFNLNDQFFSLVVDFVHADYFVECIVTLVVFFLFFIIVTPIAEGGLISIIDRIDKRDSEQANINTVWFGISRWIKNFLPIFEANNITALFKLISIITFTLFLIRLFGTQYLGYILGIMGVYFAIAITINMFLAYTRFFVVLEHMKAFDAIVASASMALEHFSITFKLYLTLMLVYVRTILTVVAFLLFPIALSAILTYATVAMVKIFFIGLLGVLGLGFIVFISHLNSVLEIFVETLWYRAYIENKKSGSGIYK
jgi:hypothetical protein